MECSPSNFGRKPGKRNHKIQEKGKGHPPRDDGEGGFQESGAPKAQERLFPKDKTGGKPRVCERTFAQLCQFGVGVGVGVRSDKFIKD